MTTSAVTPHFISENCLFPQPEHAGGVEHGRPRLAQRRTPQPALLTAQARFGGCGNFLQIKSLVEEVAGDIMGIGPMAIYDTGLYIGANLGLLPEEVWMHAGAREGALENGASCRARLLPLSAFAQGKFREMHDTLFARQDALDDADLLKYAAELSLDSDRVSRELARHEYARRVEEDQQSGLDSGVSGTPTFYIDGTRYDGSAALRDMLAAVRQLRPDLEPGDKAATNPRIPRARWPRAQRTVARRGDRS